MLDFPKVYIGPSLINKAPQRQLSQVAFRGGENNTSKEQTDNKPAIKNDDFEKVTLLKRLGKFFKDMGQAIRTLFSNKWVWQFDAVMGQLQRQGQRLGKDKEAEAVIQNFYQNNHEELKKLTLGMPGTPEQKRKREKDMAEGEAAQKDGVLAQAMLTDIIKGLNKSLNSLEPKKVAELGVEFLDGPFLAAGKAYMETRISDAQRTK